MYLLYMRRDISWQSQAISWPPPHLPDLLESTTCRVARQDADLLGMRPQVPGKPLQVAQVQAGAPSALHDAVCPEVRPDNERNARTVPAESDAGYRHGPDAQVQPAPAHAERRDVPINVTNMTPQGERRLDQPTPALRGEHGHGRQLWWLQKPMVG
jgi:hypothetical protein